MDKNFYPTIKASNRCFSFFFSSIPILFINFLSELKYSKKTPVNLIVGKYTRKMIKGYISDRAEIDRKVLRHFTKPQLRRYLIKGKFPLHIHWIEVKKGEIVKVKCTKCQYEMIKETPIAMKIMRKIFWEQWIKYGKMSSSWKEGKKQQHPAVAGPLYS